MCTGDAIHCGDAEEIVSALSEVRRREAELHAHRARLIDALARANAAHEHEIVIGIERPAERVRFVERSTRAQVACILRVSEHLAGGLMRESTRLVADLPATLDALTDGAISYRHARAVVEEADSLPDDAAASFEAAVLEGRTDLTPGAFAARCRRIRERTHPVPIETRAGSAETSRSVSLEYARDGMAWLHVSSSAAKAELAYTFLTGTAMDAQEAGDARTLDQLRADALLDAVLAPGRSDVAEGTEALVGQRVEVSITVPALTLLGQSDEPAVLDGYGPIPLETAKTLAAGSTSWHRILTHPVTGVRLTYDRATYRPPADLRRWLRRRDRTCRFPGCRRRAVRCDIDHTIAWEDGGRTDHDNLAHLCRRHHRLKHHTAWEVRFDGELLVWTDPTGHEYCTEPAEPLGSGGDSERERGPFINAAAAARRPAG